MPIANVLMNAARWHPKLKRPSRPNKGSARHMAKFRTGV